MTERTKFETGEFSWAELSTSDPVKAKEFYSGLFGWEIDDQDLPEGMGTYTNFRVGGKAVAGGSKQRDEEASGGVPPHWNLYIAVDDCDIYTKKAEAAGGTIVMQPFDVMELGRMSVIADPTGGMVGLWQAMTMPGAQLTNEPGTLEWCELMTNDVEKAKAFYTEVLDLDSEVVPMPDSPPYTLLKLNDKPVSGLMSPPTEGMPSFWTAYFNVTDCAATEAKAKDLGANVMMPTTEIPGVGTLAWFTDPQGATFAVLQPDPNAQQ